MGNFLELPQIASPMIMPAGQFGTDVQGASNKKNGISLDALTRAIVAQESSGNPRARGKAGEIGLMQLKPEIARQYGITPSKLYDPATNLWVGKQYLQQLISQFNGDIGQAVAAYNAGPSRVKSGRIPSSTQKYVNSIWNRLGNLSLGGTAYAEDVPEQLKGAKEVDNPWSKVPPAGASEVVTPWQQKGAAETAYEKARNFALPIISKGASNLNPLRNPIGLNPATGKLEPKPATAFGKSVANAVVPQTLTGAGVQAGLLATGLGEMGLLARLGIPALSGAAGAYMAGESPSTGAAEGLGSAAGGEIIGGLTGMAGNMALKDKVAKDLTRNVGQSLGGYAGRIGVRPAENAAMFERMFSLGGITRRAGQLAGDASTKANQALGGRLLNLGKTGGRGTLSDAEDLIEALNEGTYAATGAQRSVQGRGAMIRAAYDLRESVANQLNRIQPGLGTAWRQTRKDAAAAKTLQDLFSSKNGAFENGHLNQPRLEELITGKYRDRLVRTLGEGDTSKLLNAIRRGAKGPAARDIPGTPIHARMGISGHPHFSIPHTYKPVGDVPPIMHSAGTNPTRIPAGMSIADILSWFGQPTEGGTQ